MRTKMLLILGLIVVVVCISAVMSGADDAEEKEETVTLDQLPAAVRATLDQELGGGTLVELEKETEDGKVVYEAEFTRDGVTWEVEIAADGTVLEREQEDAEDQDDD